MSPYLVYSVAAELVELFPDVVVELAEQQLHEDPEVLEGGGGRHQVVERPPHHQLAEDLVPEPHGPLVTRAVNRTFTKFHSALRKPLHVATELAPILSHLFGAEFGLELLLEIG